MCSWGGIRTRDLTIMSRALSPTELPSRAIRNPDDRAPCGNRTHYLFLTKEVLYR